jgi:hypothetical protein
MDTKELIFSFVSTHEAIVSNNLRNRDSEIKARFTTFGNRAACKAIHDIIEVLSEDEKLKVVEMMKSKRVISD